MDIKIIIVIGIGLVCLVIFSRLVRNKNGVQKQMTLGTFKAISLVLLVTIVACFFLVGNKIYRNGIGELFTDYAEIKADSNNVKRSGGEDATAETLIITVNLDKILIDNITYSSVAAAQQVIVDAVTAGKGLRVIDDYALAKTYNELIEAITKMNVARASIEEIKQP